MTNTPKADEPAYVATLYAKDGCHAGRGGEYLLGCVWFEFLFKEDVRTLKFVPEGLADADAAALREIAHQAVALEKEKAK